MTSAIIDPFADPELYMQYMTEYKNNDIDYIIYGIYISNWNTAINKDALIANNISDILCITPLRKSEKTIAMYNKLNINHYQFNIIDEHNSDILAIFDQTFNIIDNAVKGKRKILVHCQEGVSRSVTIVIAYLIKKQKLKNIPNILKAIQTKRPVAHPNSGFLTQLNEYSKGDRKRNNKLDKKQNSVFKLDTD